MENHLSSDFYMRHNAFNGVLTASIRSMNILLKKFRTAVFVIVYKNADGLLCNIDNAE